MNHSSNSSESSGSVSISDARVLDNPAHERFDLWLGDELVGILGYRDEGEIPGFNTESGEVIAFMHTVVKEEFSGRGLAAVLVREALDSALARGWKVRPICTYVQRYLARNSERLDVLVPD
ncbi:acetyltransferase [Rhodococcus sp. WMMA185]|uniref:GNAT family N-acetyltransferase n=1 Tax=Rhodococcus sp. WMMA185 TaxID=679318 RepID=UPI000878202A|nr:GNAT family N-acetyltransferase [Rhodococcus sp. WMMA185]AOW93284.1 acetyltransferase [Rhodococcus sp. WMMA185]